jgi:hypothetical protein
MKEDEDFEKYKDRLDSMMWKGLALGCIIMFVAVLLVGICYR